MESTCLLTITTLQNVGLENISFSLALMQNSHIFADINLDYTTVDTYKMNQPIDALRVHRYTFPSAIPFPVGVTKSYGISGFELDLATNNRIAFEVMQRKYSADQLEAYFDIASCK